MCILAEINTFSEGVKGNAVINIEVRRFGHKSTSVSRRDLLISFAREALATPIRILMRVTQVTCLFPQKYNRGFGHLVSFLASLETGDSSTPIRILTKDAGASFLFPTKK